MLSCDICHKEFSRPQALNGHRRLAHPTSEHSGSRDDFPGSWEELAKALSEDTSTDLKAGLDRLEGALVSIDDQLDQLLSEKGNDATKHLCKDPECTTCKPALENHRWQVAQETVALFRQNVPGVAEAHDKSLEGKPDPEEDQVRRIVA